MINVLNMTKTGVVDDLFEFKFDFEFDNASTLPTKFVVIEQQKYLIANDSTAKNLSTDTYYKYNSADACWVRSLAKTPTPAPKDNTQITENGNYNIVNNSFRGYNDINVNVSGSGGDVTLIEKSVTENGEYSASDDNADGYSKVTVDVSGGGGEPFIIEVTGSGSSYSVDKTAAEMIDAINNNKYNILFSYNSSYFPAIRAWDYPGEGSGIVGSYAMIESATRTQITQVQVSILNPAATPIIKVSSVDLTTT